MKLSLKKINWFKLYTGSIWIHEKKKNIPRAKKYDKMHDHNSSSEALHGAFWL